MDPMGVGVIGTGDISDVYLANLSRYPRIVRLVAAQNRTRPKAERQAVRYGIGTVHDTVEELLADPQVELVLNLTPPEAHAPINIAALSAGRHVYSEKPLATTLQDAVRTRDHARDLGLRLGCAPDTWLGGRAQTMREIIDSGQVGEITAGVATIVYPGLEWFHPSPFQSYRADVGPLADIGIYYVSMLVALLGPVRQVAAMDKKTFDERTAHYGPIAGRPIPVEVETHVSASLEFEQGAVVTLLVSTDVPDSQLPRLELYGTRGTLCMPETEPMAGPNIFGGPLWIRTLDDARYKDIPRPDPTPWTVAENHHRFNETDFGADPSVPRINSRGIGLVDEVLAIAEGRPMRCSGDLACHVLDVIESIYASSRQRRFVEVASSCRRPAPLPADFPGPQV
jgi:predicted dehydrogenase